MADIVFNYEKMRETANTIRDIATRYQSAASTLESDFTNAVSSWEGESHDKMVQFISGAVMEYTRETVPKLLNALAELLDENANQMEKADADIGASIPQSLGG